jgi:hypothetical protein
LATSIQSGVLIVDEALSPTAPMPTHSQLPHSLQHQLFALRPQHLQRAEHGSIGAIIGTTSLPIIVDAVTMPAL